MYEFNGRAVFTFRRRAGLSREQFGALIGRSFSVVAGYETGRVYPPPAVIARIANALDVTPGDLFSKVDESSEVVHS